MSARFRVDKPVAIKEVIKELQLKENSNLNGYHTPDKVYPNLERNVSDGAAAYPHSCT
jgi:hypothetical protein